MYEGTTKTCFPGGTASVRGASPNGSLVAICKIVALVKFLSSAIIYKTFTPGRKLSLILYGFQTLYSSRTNKSKRSNLVSDKEPFVIIAFSIELALYLNPLLLDRPNTAGL